MAALSPISNAVREILAEADSDIAARRPVCKASGRCCRFEEYGHRLYVTTAELAYFSEVQNPANICKESATPVGAKSVSLEQFFSRETPPGCPYQVDGLCTAREARPLGCRIYFCDANAQSWQEEVYEKYHARLKTVHVQFNLSYQYVEWRAGLREVLVNKISCNSAEHNAFAHRES